MAGVFTKEGTGPKAPLTSQEKKWPLSSSVADILRLRLVSEFLETTVHGEKEQASRGTKESHFAEAWVRSIGEGGIRLKKHERFCAEMRERSPHVDGMQIDAIVKALMEGNRGSYLGTPYDEEARGWIQKIADTIRGRESQ